MQGNLFWSIQVIYQWYLSTIFVSEEVKFGKPVLLHEMNELHYWMMIAQMEWHPACWVHCGSWNTGFLNLFFAVSLSKTIEWLFLMCKIQFFWMMLLFDQFEKIEVGTTYSIQFQKTKIPCSREVNWSCRSGSKTSLKRNRRPIDEDVDPVFQNFWKKTLWTKKICSVECVPLVLSSRQPLWIIDLYCLL